MKDIHILYLYANEMNTYGDQGNVHILEKRLDWHGFKPVIHRYGVGDSLPKQIDIVFGGGGQDSAQGAIEQDIARIGEPLRKLAGAGTPMLLVCGCYQLFGQSFTTHDGVTVKGIGIFDLKTQASKKRMIGNTKVNSRDFGTLYGFENHSGRTMLGNDLKPLGRVERGGGNNGQDKTEGAISNNIFGTYMHGPVLAYNPQLADFMIKQASVNRYGNFTPKNIDDSLVEQVRALADKRKY